MKKLFISLVFLVFGFTNSFAQGTIGIKAGVSSSATLSGVHAENDMRVGEFSKKEADMIDHASLVVDMNEVNNNVSFLSDYSKDQDLGYNENQIKAVAYFSIFSSSTISTKKNDGKPIEITKEVRNSFTSFVKLQVITSDICICVHK
ncbi:hypothetical protein [Flammeovirga kamogawensis]|uniref:Uncharacterized protein n=1 Tax=Flammeovirga kamogawensis TaxID=373891 RepID=A0ABX8GTG1_9BACT|nr:hypothetical protein [Flammeovirga kamogawensis]MBB6463316.1 hypothetical protein [Flammeovirga kamogawensis]QWG06709.1 hypothetical protein KM029_15550 [Flammeovirga kamogawensis]TRX68531.1 hypothetical protein EO216_10545 [Flammeovirga kamogawensis]